MNSPIVTEAVLLYGNNKLNTALMEVGSWLVEISQHWHIDLGSIKIHFPTVSA